MTFDTPSHFQIQIRTSSHHEPSTSGAYAQLDFHWQLVDGLHGSHHVSVPFKDGVKRWRL